MFPKSKRFQDSVPQAPPVGLYDVKLRSKSGGTSFAKGRRFVELKDAGPGLSDINPLNISSCSTSSWNDNKCSIPEFATPLPLRKLKSTISSTPKQKEDPLRISALETEISRLLTERADLENRLAVAQQEVRTLKTKLQGNSTNNPNLLSALEEELKTVRAHLQEKDGVLSTLRLSLSYEVENLKADLHLEQERNKALNERISSLERTNTEIANDRDEVEEANQKLHDLVAQLQRENILLKEQLDEEHRKLEEIHVKLEETTQESQNKIIILEDMLSKELIKGQGFGKKLECSLKQSQVNFDNAQARIKQLEEVNSCLERNAHDLESKLFEIINREQQAEEKSRRLEVDKDSLESRLRKCERDYEQRLSIANDQVDSLQQELQRCEEMLTQNLKSMTDKYLDLEESYSYLQTETKKEKQLISSELEATQKSLLESQGEYEKQQSTCLLLKQHNEQLQEECEETNQQLQTIKEEVESVRKQSAEQENKAEVAKEEARSLREELCKTKEEAEFTKASLRESLDEAHETMKVLYQREESLSQELDFALRKARTQENELETVKADLDRAKSEAKERENLLQNDVQRHQLQVQRFEARLNDLEESHARQMKHVEEKAAKSKEEFGRRLVETQKKLSQTEINFAKFKSEQEIKVKEKDKDAERTLRSVEEEVKNLKLELANKSDNTDQLNELKTQVQMWQTKYEDLQRKIEPFKDQLDEYEAERIALLSQNNQAKDEVAKLGQQYATLLGHQNKKQKIRHVIKLKEENGALKAEITKLRDQAEKQKRNTKKLEEKLDHLCGKKRFNPADAFSYSRKENVPLSVIANGNVSS